MKTIKYLVLSFFLFIYFGAIAQSGNCYEIKASMSGYGTSLYPEIMFDTICKLVKIIDDNDNNSVPYKVLSYDVYPILAYADPADGINYQISEIKKEFTAFSEFAAVIKSFVGGNINYNFYLKLPTSGIFSSLSTLETEAIQLSVEAAMIEANGILPGNMNTEIHGFRIFNGYLKQIKEGTLNIDVFDKLNFQKIIFNQSETYITSNNTEISENIRDYSGIKNNQNKLLRSSLIEGSKSLPYGKSMIYILTSASMPNFNASMQNAKYDFDNLKKDFVVWLHFKNDLDSTRVWMDVKSNISKHEAAYILDQEYEQSMSYFNESIEWYNDEFQIDEYEEDDIEALEYDEGEIEEDTIVTLVNNNSNNNNTKEDRISPNKTQIQEREIHHPYDCTTLQCYSLKWKAYCCLLTDLERNNITTDYQYLYSKAIGCGIIDGFAETCGFLHTLFELSRDLNPYHAGMDLGYFIMKYGAAKGIELKANRYIDLFNNYTGFIQSLISPQTWSMMLDMIKQGVDELVFNEGFTIQGYRVGNIVFAILLDFATSGGAEIKTFTQISKVGAQQLIKLSKDPTAFASAVRSAIIKYVNKSKKNLKKLKFATAGRLNAQKNIRSNFLNGRINLGTFGSYIYKKRTGNIGEILVDVDLQENGYQIFTKPILHIDDNVHKGLDHVAKKNGQYYVIESKYNTAKQKVFGGNLQGSYDYAMADSRLLKACGQEVYIDIREKGFTLLLAKINPNGNITYHILDEFGRKTGTYWSP